MSRQKPRYKNSRPLNRAARRARDVRPQIVHLVTEAILRNDGVSWHSIPHPQYHMAALGQQLQRVNYENLFKAMRRSANQTSGITPLINGMPDIDTL